MTRLLIILFLAILLSLLGGWFYSHPGTLLITWLGYRIELTILVALLGGVFLLLAVYFVYKSLAWILGVPFRLHMSWKKRLTAKAENSFIDMVSAYYAGETNEALRIRRKLLKKLEDMPLFLWYSGLILTQGRNHPDAELSFVKLSQKKGGEFLSLRGQADEAMAQGNLVVARDFLEKARTLRDRSPWVLKTLYQVYKGTNNFEAAEKLLDSLEDLSLMAGESVKKEMAHLQFLRSQLKMTSDVKREELLRQSHYLNPAAEEVTLAFARLLEEKGNGSYAKSALEATWKLAPTDALGELYISLFKDKTPVERYEIASRLAALVPGSLEGKLLKTRCALDAKLWGEARSLLATIESPTEESYLLEAQLERDEQGDLQKVNDLLMKAFQLRTR